MPSRTAIIARRISASSARRVVLRGVWLCAACADPPEPTEHPLPAVHVQTREVHPQMMPISLTLPGTLRGARHAELAANASGLIVATMVERGAEVAEGGALARLDVRAPAFAAQESAAQVRAAVSQDAAARADCARARALLDRGAITRQDYERAEVQCESQAAVLVAARTRAALAAKTVADGIIRAPFGGLVVERFVNVGEYVREDSKVVTLTATNPLRLELTVPESKLATIQVGQPITFTVRGEPGRSFTSTVKRIGGAVRETSRDVVIEGEVANQDHRLLPGTFVIAEITVAEASVPVVPVSALVARGTEQHVFVVVRDRAEERAVQPGVSRGGEVAIARGVAAGDRVVVRPPDTLHNGQAVR